MQLNGDWPRERTQAHALSSARVIQQVAVQCSDAILQAATLMAETFRSGGKVLLCGNGGSAADCQHMAAELVSRLTADFERPGLPAIALTTDTSFLTAFANDCGYEGIFARQVQALGRPGDLLIGISTSGSSTNVLHAVELARRAAMHTVVLTGAGGRLVEIADVTIAVPSANTQYVQEAHLMIEHILCDLAERHLFGEQGDGRRHEGICHAPAPVVGQEDSIGAASESGGEPR
jgi:phosphoheptose isomerase